jgi:hypothetical protein
MATRRPAMGVAALAVLAFTIMGLFAGTAGAHSGTESYAYLDVSDTELGGRLDLPVPDLEQALGLDLEADTIDETMVNVAANRDVIDPYLQDNFAIGTEGAAWPVTYLEAEPLDEGDDIELYILFPFEVDVPLAEVPRVFDVTFEPFLDIIDDRRPQVLIRNDWKGGFFEAGDEILAVFGDDSRTQTIDLGDTGWWKNFRASIDLGVDHIKTGPDHILFIMVLVLPAVAIYAAGAWRPVPTFGSALWRVLKIVTMFTVAHSITFTLAGLDILPLPSPRITESIIAISIAAAAFNIVRPVVANKEWLISFLFGLFHGMGFASLIEGLEVDRGTQLISLLGRNVGIEIGQAAVVVLVFPALFLLRRTIYYRPFLTVSALVLTVVSLGWAVERAFQTDLGIDAWVDPVLQWPRSLAGIAVVTAIFGGLYLRERSAGRLLPVWEGDATPEDPSVEEPEPALV